MCLHSVQEHIDLVTGRSAFKTIGNCNARFPYLCGRHDHLVCPDKVQNAKRTTTTEISERRRTQRVSLRDRF